MKRSIPLALVAALMLAAAPAAASGGGGAADGPHLVPLDALDVPIVEGPRTTGRLHVRLVLRAADAAAAQALTDKLPSLREASFLAVSDFARLYASPWTPVDAGRLAAALDAALRPRAPGLRSVLLVQVMAARG